MDEVARFHEATPNVEYTRGLGQAIGFKQLRDGGNTEQFKTAHYQYAKRQLTWIRNKFVKENAVNILNANDIEEWQEHVETPAVEILTEFMLSQGNSVSFVGSNVCTESAVTNSSQKSKTLVVGTPVYECLFCSGKWRGESEWQQHIRSRSHRRNKKRLSD